MNHERRNWLAVMVVVGAALYSLGYGNYIMDQARIQTVSSQLGQEKSAVARLATHDDCMTRRASIAAMVANDPDGDVSLIPSCPPPPKVKK